MKKWWKWWWKWEKWVSTYKSKSTDQSMRLVWEDKVKERKCVSVRTYICGRIWYGAVFENKMTSWSTDIDKLPRANITLQFTIPHIHILLHVLNLKVWHFENRVPYIFHGSWWYGMCVIDWYWIEFEKVKWALKSGDYEKNGFERKRIKRRLRWVLFHWEKKKSFCFSRDTGITRLKNFI